MGKMKKCTTCSKEIAVNAKSCPQCGAKNTKPFYKKWWVWLIILIIIMGFGSGGDSSDSELETGDNQEVSQVEKEEKVDTKVEDTPQVEENIPTEYKSALKKAQSYNKTMSMSKAGLYDQLTSEYGEKFTAEAAQYAIDNVEVDWKENALKKAQSYNKTMSMSKAGLYDQLISEYGEKFTSEEAQYAIDTIDADWKENALKKAKSYQETMSMSPSAIYDQLISSYGEEFTAEEAQYAIDNLQ